MRNIAILISSLLIGLLAFGCSASESYAPSKSDDYYRGGYADAAGEAEPSPVYPDQPDSGGGSAVIRNIASEEEVAFDFDDDTIDGDLTRADGANLAPPTAGVKGPPAKSPKREPGVAQDKKVRTLTDRSKDGTKESKLAPKDEAKATEKPAGRIIIYVGNIGVYVFDMDEARKKVAELTRELGGYVQQSSETNIILRIPADKFDFVISELSAMGDIAHKNIIGTDVTEEFYDLTVRLKNAQVMRQRYIELLAKAKDVKESLLIEKELGRITEQIERFKGRLKFLQSHASLSTVNLTLYKKANEPPKVTRVPLPFYWLRGYRLENVLY